LHSFQEWCGSSVGRAMD